VIIGTAITFTLHVRPCFGQQTVVFQYWHIYYCYYLVFNFMQGIYSYIPETNHVSRVYIVATVLVLRLVLHEMLFRPWIMFCTLTLAHPVVCVQCSIRLFFQFLNFVLAWYVAQVLCEWFWNGYYYYY